MHPEWNNLENKHAHATTSGFVFTPDRKKVLMIHHKRLNKWLPPGGHIDPNELPHIAALREIYEETGVNARHLAAEQPLQTLDLIEEIQIPHPQFLLVERIPASDKDTEHWHIDHVYLLEANESPLTRAEAEVHDARWCTREDVRNLDTYASIIEITERFMC